MTTTHDDRWKLPDGLEWLDVSQGACRYYVSNDAGDILVLGASGESYGSLKDRPDAAHLEALLRARNGYVLPPGFEWRRDEDVNDYVFSTATGCAWVRADGTCYCSVQGPLRPMLRELVLMRAGRRLAPEPVVIGEVVRPTLREKLRESLAENERRVTAWPAEVREAMSTREVFSPDPHEPRGCPTPGACSAVRSYDDGYAAGFDGAVEVVRARLGLPIRTPRWQVLDAVQAVRQATPDAIVRGCNELHAQLDAADVQPGRIGAPNSFERLRERVTMALARLDDLPRIAEIVQPPKVRDESKASWGIRPVKGFGHCITRDGQDVAAFDDLDELASELASLVRGEQATPVRDESVPPPGVTLQRCMPHGNPGVQIHYDDGLGLVAGVQCHLGDIVAEEDVPEVLRLLWRKYDSEHGYAPPAADAKADTKSVPANWPEIEKAVLRVVIQRAMSIAVDQDEIPPYLDDAIGSLRDVMPRDAFQAAAAKAVVDSMAKESAKAQEVIAKLKINRAPTYAEVLEAAAAAKREIEAEWPEWKKEIR